MMRGSPPWRALAIALPFLALAWPLAVLTRPAEASREKNGADLAPPVGETREFRADLVLKTSHPFESVEFLVGERKVVWSAGESERELVLPIVGAELPAELVVFWQGEPERAALSLEILPDFLPEREWTVWGAEEGETRDFRVFRWDENYFAEEEK